jgi:hypothetical protein
VLNRGTFIRKARQQVLQSMGQLVYNDYADILRNLILISTFSRNESSEAITPDQTDFEFV